jgi:hypothetical protein
MFDGRGMPIPAFGLLFVLGCLVIIVGTAFGVGWYARGIRSKAPLPPPIVIFDGTNYTAITNIVRVP